MKTLVFILFLGSISNSRGTYYNEQNAQKFIIRSNSDMSARFNKQLLAYWDYYNMISEENRQKLITAQTEFAQFEKKRWQEVNQYPWKTFKNESLKRQFKIYSVLGKAILPENKMKRLSEVISEMQKHFATSKICDYKISTKCDLIWEPDINNILKTSQDLEELKYVWLQWHNKSGIVEKNRYVEYVGLVNEAARLDNFTDYSEYWLRNYEKSDFWEQLKKLWSQLEPLYQQLHAYFRHKLRTQYGNEVVLEKGPIPDYLLLNSYASYALPFPQKTKVNITSEMMSQKYTPLKIFKLAEEFYKSINLSSMPQSYWEKSIIEKPTQQESDCQPSSWDFLDGNDFRTKLCTVVNEKDLITVHNLMGYIEYYIQYKDQPLPFKKAANPGFNDAVSGVMSLSVKTANHLKRIGLLKSNADDFETRINNLYKVALDEILPLPFSYTLELWRREIFKGNIAFDNYNTEWWNLKKQYQGVQPSVTRTTNDFDPATVYHVANDVPYIRYFVSVILKFQLYKALCQKANQYQPEDLNKQLHMCSISNSTEAGNSLKKMLKLGLSKPWPEALEVVTGTREMDAGPLLEYFLPLQTWLEEHNKIHNLFIGWDSYDNSTNLF